MSRDLHLKTPGKLILDVGGTPTTFYSSTGWKAELMETLVDISSTRWGVYDQAVTGRLVKITGQPTQFNAAALAKLFTHGTTRMGGSIVGATDKVASLHTVDGKKRTMKCAFVQQEPAMTCMAGKTILGDTVIYGIVPLTGGSDDLSNLWAQASVAWSDADWNPDDEITPGWDFSWPITGTPSAWDAMDVKDKGVTVTPKSDLTEDVSSRDGLINVTIKNYSVEVAAEVMNISETLVLDALGRNLPMGGKKSSLGRDLILNAVDESAFIRIYNAVLQPTSFVYDAENHVAGNLTWRSFPGIASGVRGAHLYVSTTNPDD